MSGYGLGEVLQAHSDDVKCVIAADKGTLLSASRDNTVGVWRSGGEDGVSRLGYSR
jgi:WD40 repeat protein